MTPRLPSSTAKLPTPETYELEYDFWPWGTLLSKTADLVAKITPPRGLVVDLMCGTGYLLHQIHRRRPDLRLCGCDISVPYVQYAQRRYPEANVVVHDALLYRPPGAVSTAICTAGIHHLERDMQPELLKKIADLMADDGQLVVGEELIPEHGDLIGRKLAVIALSSRLLSYATERSAPDAVLEAATDVLCNDLLERGEYKLTLSGVCDLLSRRFRIETQDHIWPADQSDSGDYVFLCHPSSRAAQDPFL